MGAQTKPAYRQDAGFLIDGDRIGQHALVIAPAAGLRPG